MNSKHSKLSLRGLCLAIGLLLLLAAAVLAGYNLYTDWHAGQTAQSVAARLPSAAAQNSAAGAQRTQARSGPMPEVEIDGSYYIGTLELPALGLSLPVHTHWDDAEAKTAPCRYIGSAYEDNMIIAGHNYRSHFGRLSELQIGDEVLFTDVEGNVFRYKVAAFDNIDMYDTQAMLEGDWALTVFTCDATRVHRLTVRCEAAADD